MNYYDETKLITPQRDTHQKIEPALSIPKLHTEESGRE